MAKPLFQDIVPPEKRSIKKITRTGMRPRYETEIPRTYDVKEEEPVRTSRYIPEPQASYHEEEEEKVVPPPRVPRKRKGTRFSPLLLILVVLIIGGGVGFYVLSRVSGAWVSVTPQYETVTVNAPFTAVKSGVSATSTLQFQTVTIAKDGKINVIASGEEVANTKASGTIIIYNTTATAQKLVATTRFETPKGLIFRINQPVTIPAQQNNVPGSVEAVVTADAVGPQYNVGLTDFTIPGFKGDAKYTKIYARSKTAMQGGFSGTRKKVNETERKTAQEKVRTELQNTLVREVEKNIPDGFVLPQNSYVIEYESLADVNTETGVQINERATFHGFIFNRTSLAEEISRKVAGHMSGPTDLVGIDTLTFTSKATSSTSTILQFSLSGTTTLVSVIDQESLKDELAGKPRKSLNAIMAGHPTITNAEVTMRPFWRKFFPTNTAEIVITVTKVPNP